MDYRWEDLRVFLALYRQRTLAGAGSKVGLDASTVSRRLAGLEEALGTTLFDRTRDGVIPTASAEQLLPAAEDVERSAISVLHVAEGLELKAEGVVRVTAPPLLVDAFLAPALPMFRERWPAIRLDFLASVSFADLTRREADIALRTSRATSGDLVSVRAASSQYGVFGSPRFVEALGVVSSWSAVSFAAWSDELSHLPSAKWLVQQAPDVVPFVRSNSLGSLIAAARCGAAAVVVSEIAARHFGLVPLRCAPSLAAQVATLPKEDMWLIGHRALRSVPRISAVWAFLRDELLAQPVAFEDLARDGSARARRDHE